MLLQTRLILLAAMCALVPVMPVMAEDTVLFNYSPAYDCYRATLRDHQKYDLENCNVAIEDQPLRTDELAATYSNRGILLSRNGELEDALKDHNRAVELGPEMSSTYINRANTLVRAKRYSDAMNDLDHAVQIADGALAVAHYNRSLLFHRLGDLRSARAEAEKASTLSPESMAYRQYFEQLLEVQPN